MREQVPSRRLKVEKFGVYGSKDLVGSKIDLAIALEAGRIVSRDIGGSDPERMAAPRYVTRVKLTIELRHVKTNTATIVLRPVNFGNFSSLKPLKLTEDGNALDSPNLGECSIFFFFQS